MQLRRAVLALLLVPAAAVACGEDEPLCVTYQYSGDGETTESECMPLPAECDGVEDPCEGECNAALDEGCEPPSEAFGCFASSLNGKVVELSILCETPDAP